MPVFLLSVGAGEKLALLVQITSRVEVFSVRPVRFSITVQLPYVDDDCGTLGDEVAVVDVVRVAVMRASTGTGS